MSRKFESFERINSIRETNGNFDSCNSCKRLVPSRLHELHESKFPFVSRIEFIRSKLSNFSAHVYGVNNGCPPSGRPGGTWIGSERRQGRRWRGGRSSRLLLSHTRQSHHRTLPHAWNNHGKRRFIYWAAAMYNRTVITNCYTNPTMPTFKVKIGVLMNTRSPVKWSYVCTYV